MTADLVCNFTPSSAHHLSFAGPLATAIPWDLIGGVVLFVVMIVGALLLSRLFSGRGLVRQSRYLRILDRYPINRDCQILVVNIGERVLAVCVGRDGGNLLCELDPATLNLTATSTNTVSSGDEPERSTFRGRFWHNFRMNMGLMPKGTKPMTPPPKTQPSGGADSEAFAAILDALQRREADNLAGKADDESSAPLHKSADHAAADYRAAVDNMRRLAQTDKAAPAARTAPPSASPAGPVPAAVRRAGSTDEDTARELLRVLQEQRAEGARHETAKPAHTKNAPPTTQDGALDEILDSIAKRQSRYSSGQPGTDSRKDRL